MDFRGLINKIEQMGELKLVEGADWDLEIGAITHVVANGANPPALLFDNVKNCEKGFRILTLPCSTEKRICLVMGFPLELRGLEIVKWLRNKLNEPLDLIKPVEVESSSLFENIQQGDQVDLFKFPAPQWQKLDGGRYIGTGDTVIVQDPDEGWINMSAHRIQVHGRNEATIYMEPGRHADIIRKKYWKKGQGCPVAVTLGAHPLYTLIGGTRIPWGMSEYDYMGWWTKEPVKVIKGPLTGLPVPADAEIVLEGEIVPEDLESKMEGPFAEWSGHYSPAKPEAVFKVNGVLHRDNPIVLATLPYVGPGVITYGTHLIRAAYCWNHLEKIVPGVKGVWTHEEFGSSHFFVISIEQKYAGHAKQTALATLGHHNYLRKFVVVVDEDVDPSNLREVLFAIGMRSNPEKWDVVRDCWDGYLDPLLSPEKRAVGDTTHSAVMILACKPYHWIEEFPASVRMDPELVQQVREKWKDIIH